MPQLRAQTTTRDRFLGEPLERTSDRIAHRSITTVTEGPTVLAEVTINEQGEMRIAVMKRRDATDDWAPDIEITVSPDLMQGTLVETTDSTLVAPGEPKPF